MCGLLKEEKTCEEYRCIVGDKVEEAKWKGLVNDHWQHISSAGTLEY